MSTTKKNQVFETPQDEIRFLRKQVGGLKGNVTFTQKKLNEKSEKIKDLREKLGEQKKITDGLHAQIGALKKQIAELTKDKELQKQENNTLRATVEYYESLKWWQRIFL